MGNASHTTGRYKSLKRLIAAVVWLGVVGFFGGMLFGTLYRTDPAESGPIETALVFLSLLIQSFAFHAGIMVGLACLVAVVLKHKRLGVALALGAGLLLGPAAASHLPGTIVPPNDDDLVVLSANVLYTNGDPEPLIALVRELEPDVLLIQEYRASWSGALHRALGEVYPHQVELPSNGAYGEAVFSKRPFLESPVFGPDGWSRDRPLVLFTIEHGGQRVEIGNVHLMAPLNWGAVAEQRRQVVDVASWVEQRMRSPDAPAALILAGDFNAPYMTNHLRELRSVGLREAHHESGVGRGASWGPRRAPLSWAPGIRLDHVMFTGEAKCTASGVGGDIGSDHRPVWASLRIGSD